MSRVGIASQRVRKHRAPKGELRLVVAQDSVLYHWALESTERPKISHAIPLAQTSMNGENRDISTAQLQVLKDWKPNCMRHFPTTIQDEHHKVH